MRQVVSGVLHWRGDQFLLLPEGGVVTITGDEARRLRVAEEYGPLLDAYRAQVHSDPVAQAGFALADALGGRFVEGESEGEDDPLTDADGNRVIF